MLKKSALYILYSLGIMGSLSAMHSSELMPSAAEYSQEELINLSIISIVEGNEMGLRQAISKGLNVNTKLSQPQGECLLVLATMQQNARAVRILLEADADANMVVFKTPFSPTSGKTPLQLAHIHGGNSDIIALLTCYSLLSTAKR